MPARTWVLTPSCLEYTGAQITVQDRESIMTYRLTMTKTRCLRGSREPGFRTRYNSPASRQLLIRQRVHGFAIQTLGTALDDLDVFLVACLSFQAREVTQSGAIQADQQFLG